MIQPVVEDENIITACGNAFNDFAVHIARKLGYECPDKILSGYVDNKQLENYLYHLPPDAIEEFKQEYSDFI